MKHNPQFTLGDVECDDDIYHLIDYYDLDLRYFFQKHIRCNWGEITGEKAEEQDLIIKNREVKEVKSIWNFSGENICIITNPERTLTKVKVI